MLVIRSVKKVVVVVLAGAAAAGVAEVGSGAAEVHTQRHESLSIDLPERRRRNPLDLAAADLGERGPHVLWRRGTGP